MLQKIGYSHINSSNTEIKFWGNTLGVDFAAPDRVILENGDIVEAATAYVLFNDDSMVVERWVESNPTTEIDTKIGETIEFREDKIVVVYQYALPELQNLKEHLKSKLAEKRWQVETNGTEFNSNNFATDRESQTKYTAVAVAISQADPLTWSINWKTNDGVFLTLNASEMMAVINHVMTHVQNSFNIEYQIQTQIDSCSTIQEAIAIDIEQQWSIISGA
jgi:hypothetical protein